MKVAQMLKRHLPNILTYFTHRITNVALEGLNNRIVGVVKKAYGYRNREHLKTNILFYLSSPNLYRIS